MTATTESRRLSENELRWNLLGVRQDRTGESGRVLNALIELNHPTEHWSCPIEFITNATEAFVGLATTNAITAAWSHENVQSAATAAYYAPSLLIGSSESAFAKSHNILLTYTQEPDAEVGIVGVGLEPEPATRVAYAAPTSPPSIGFFTLYDDPATHQTAARLGGEIRVTEALWRIVASIMDSDYEQGAKTQLSYSLSAYVKQFGSLGIDVFRESLSRLAHWRCEKVSIALITLGKIDDRPTSFMRGDALAAFLRSDDPWVREGAVLGLSFIDDPWFAPAIERAMQVEPLDPIRESFQQVLDYLPS